jgi:hypothetical protein
MKFKPWCSYHSCELEDGPPFCSRDPLTGNWTVDLSECWCPKLKVDQDENPEEWELCTTSWGLFIEGR